MGIKINRATINNERLGSPFANWRERCVAGLSAVIWGSVQGASAIFPGQFGFGAGTGNYLRRGRHVAAVLATEPAGIP